MDLLLRTLEDWTAYQDYLWFLGVVAWGTVGVAAVQLLKKGNCEPSSANCAASLLALAISGVSGAAAELTLLVHPVEPPYLLHDAIMGAAQAIGVAALLWAGSARSGSRLARILFAALPPTAFGIFRTWSPVYGGALLGMFGAFGAGAVVHAIERGEALQFLRIWQRRQAQIALGCLTIGGALATHGPIAALVGEPRAEQDVSHFALPAVLLLIASGALLAIPLWRYLLDGGGPLGRAFQQSLSRDFSRGLLLLAVWLTLGFVLAVSNGRTARQSFETGLLRRATTCTALIPRELVEAAFSTELKIGRVYSQTHVAGWKRQIVSVPELNAPIFDRWRDMLKALSVANPDVPAIYVEVVRDGWLFAPVTSLMRSHHTESPATRLASLRPPIGLMPSLQGPIKSYFGSQAVFARAPLLGTTDEPLGWLVFGVSVPAWRAAFIVARIQSMALTALGCVLWGIMLGSRLRREKRREAARQAAAAMESARLRTAFLAKVSHELRTPIQSVLGYGELLAETALENRAQRWVHALRSHGELLLRLVNDLLDISALEASAFRLRPTSTDLHTLIVDSAASLRVRAEAKGLSLQVSVADEVPAWVEIDPERVRQILLNLLGNAVKYTAHGGVSLLVTVGSESTTETVVIEFLVLDTGPGIPQDARAKLFQPFMQLNDTSEGSGLGLSLVAGLCAAMGGSVTCEEKPRPGSAFRVRLPVRQCEPATVQPTPSLKVDYRGHCIVVADDNPFVREFLIETLRGRGARVIAAENGKAAVAVCLQAQPFAVVLDLAMPIMDGLAAATAIRRELGAAVRIVGLSAHASVSEEQLARAAGMDAFLTKPVSPVDLHRMIMKGPSQNDGAGCADEIALQSLRAKLQAQFQSEVPAVLIDIVNAIRERRWEFARARTHYLKGSADVMGAHRLQRACQAMLDAAICDDVAGAHHAGEIEAATLEAIAVIRTEHASL